MSASYVRNLFRQWCDAAAIATNFPFYDTINKAVEPTEPVWWTCVFVSESHEGTICDAAYFERGYIELAFLSFAGVGDGPAIAALETVLPVIMANVDPGARLVLEKYDPIIEESGGTADSTYRVYVTINYSFGPP